MKKVLIRVLVILAALVLVQGCKMNSFTEDYQVGILILALFAGLAFTLGVIKKSFSRK